MCDRRELRHGRQQPAGAGAGDLHVQGQEHQLRAPLPPGHVGAERAPGLRHRRCPGHAERGPPASGVRPVLRRVVGGHQRAALRRRRPVPVHQRRQRGHPGGRRGAGAPGHAEPGVGAPVRGGHWRPRHDGRGHERARHVVPAVPGRLLRGGGAGDGAHRLVPVVEGRAAAGERVPVLRLLGQRRAGGARVRAVVVGRQRGVVVVGDGRRGGVHQHVRRDRGRDARGGGEGRGAGTGAGGVGDRVAVGRRRRRRHRGERGGVQQQRGAARRRRHPAAAREGRGDVPVRHVQRERQGRGRGAALRPLPAGHERGLPRRLHGGFFLG